MAAAFDVNVETEQTRAHRRLGSPERKNHNWQRSCSYRFSHVAMLRNTIEFPSPQHRLFASHRSLSLSLFALKEISPPNGTMFVSSTSLLL